MPVFKKRLGYVSISSLASIPIIVGFLVQKEVVFLVAIFLAFGLFIINGVLRGRYVDREILNICAVIALYLLILSLFRAGLGGYNFLGMMIYLGSGGVFFATLLMASSLPNVFVNNIFNSVRVYTFAQIPLIIIQAFPYGFSPGDYSRAFFQNAHFAGFFLYLFIFYELLSISEIKSISNRVGRYVLCIFAFYAAYLTDSNSIFGAFVSAMLVSYLFLGSSFRIKVFGCAAFLGAAFFFYVKFWAYIQAYGSIPKLAGYSALLKIGSNNPLDLVFGLGPGQFSSRAAVISAPSDLIAKPSGNLLPFSDYSIYFKEHLAPLYTPEFYESLKAAGVTGTFYTPFSSFLAFVSEYGLVGTLLFGLLLVKCLHRCPANERVFTFLVTIAFVAMFFYDTWFEYPMFSFFVALILGRSLGPKSKSRILK